MPEERNPYLETILKLVELTQDGKLEWHSPSKEETIEPRPGVMIESIFISKFKNTNLRIYRRRISSQKANAFFGLGKIVPNVYNAETNTFEISEVILDIIDDEGRVLWQFPKLNALNDLFTSAQYQVANVKGFVKSVLEG